MFVTHRASTLVDDLDIVVIDASPLLIEGGSSDSDPSILTITTDATGSITFPWSISVTATRDTFAN
jgi:hypothetical protein